VRLGLRKLARETVGLAVACAVGVAGAGLVNLGTGAVASAADPTPAWVVRVGSASQTLYPGTEATMLYSVKNATGAVERLHGTTTAVKTDDDSCPSPSFRVASNSAPADVDVPPGGAVNGSLVLAFDDAPVAQDACRNVGVDVVVTAS